MENKDTKYLQFPLCLMQTFFNDRKGTIDRIIDVGVYKYSQSMIYEPDAPARQLLYDYYRHKDKLTSYLSKELTRYFDDGTLLFDEDYNGFNGANSFEPESLDKLIELLTNDPKLNQAAIEYSQVHKSLETLGITGNTGHELTSGEAILNNTLTGQPWPMVNRDLLFDYYKHDKQLWEMAQFAAYVAIGSILGEKPYCFTNKQHIRSRMFGYISYKQIPEKLNPLVKELMDKYSTRYHMDKLLRQLEESWYIKTYSHNMRGTMIGNSKTTMEAMILAAETKKKSNRINVLKQQKIEVREKVLQQLNKEQQLDNENHGKIIRIRLGSKE